MQRKIGSSASETEVVSTAVNGVDGSTNITANAATTLFSGATPQNGFRIDNPGGPGCVLWVLENGTAAPNAAGAIMLSPSAFSTSGNAVGPSFFETPAGYKPVGPVSVYAQWLSGGTAPSTMPCTARMW